MPTKVELLQLQKLYKTDERIGERLGGVPAYLVAYWRRKKNIPKYSLPKFSENEVRNLWERYGDDEKCGLELGISKAAFYNWRRRYGIREKPAFLKLEQLELNFPGSGASMLSSSLYGKQTVVQKAIAAAGSIEKAEVGQAVEVEPDFAASSGDIGTLLRKFRSSGLEYVWNAGRMIIAAGQFFDSKGKIMSADTRTLREFVKRQGIRGFYDGRHGFVNQLALENGHLLPGTLAFGTDQASSGFGAVGCLGMSIDSARMANIWCKGKLELPVPASILVAIAGRRGRGIFAKDIALHLMRSLASEATEGRVLELSGSVISQMSVSERVTMTSLTPVVKAISAVCTYDATVRRFLTGRSMTTYKPLLPDKDAEYEQIFQASIDQITPLISTGPDPASIKPVAECEGQPISRVVIGYGSNGRFDDFRVTADLLKGKKVHEDCQLMILPASRSVYLEALKKGLIRIFIEAGAIVLPAGSECYLHDMLTNLTSDERILTTSSFADAPPEKLVRSEYFISSPATAAASAISAEITDPTRFVR